MKLVKKQTLEPGQPTTTAGGLLGRTVDRRTFLRGTGLAAGGAAVATTLSMRMMQRADAADAAAGDGDIQIKRSVCTHCSVGCGVVAEVQNGVWIGQEPDFDSPFNLGAHCAKGAAVREHGHGDKRLKYPMKLVGGKWQRVSWDEAIEEIGNKLLEIREQHSPDSVYWLGSAKFSNEQAYLFRKFAAMWGSNNCDHQARICHSTTVAGVANTWGYGAMTNSYNDMHLCKTMFFIGSNAAEAHPVAMQHVMRSKENGGKLIVADPRFTRTAAHSDQYMRLRSGTDVPLIWGMLYHIFENGWEDKEFIAQRVFGMEDIRAEVAKWTPEVVQDVTGVPPEQVKRAAQTMAENKPGTIVWCMGGTQHSVGNNNTRAYCVLQLALGNVGVAGGGANIFRGHDNVQGATDFGVLADSLPGYYGLAAGAWKHWCNVWDVDYEWVKSRFDQASYEEGKDQVPAMELRGITVSRWIDGVLEPAENMAQKAPIKAMFMWGHAPNSQTRGFEMKKAMELLDLLVIVDPYPTHSAVLHDRTDGVFLLPACDAVRDGRVGDGLQPLDAVAREDHGAAVRVAARPHDHVQVREEARLRGAALQAHRGERRGAAHRGHHARVQPRHVDHRLHGPEPGAPQAAPREQAHVQHHDAEGRGRTLRRRVLRPAVAVLGHAGDEASGVAEPLRHEQDRGRGRHAVPRQLRRRVPGQEPALGGLLEQGLGDRGRLPRVHGRHAQATRLVGRPHAPRSRRPPRARTGRPTCRAASSGWRSSTAARPTATARRAASSGTSRTRCRSTASRCTPRGTTSSRSTRPTRIASASGACRRATCRSRPRTTRRTIR